MKHKIIPADLQPVCGYVCVRTQACRQIKLWWGFIAVCFLDFATVFLASY